MTGSVSTVFEHRTSSTPGGEQHRGPAQELSSPPADEGFRLISQAIVNSSSMIVSVAAGAVLVPVMLHYLDRQSYGLWIAMESVATLLARIDLGLTWTVTREVAAGGASEDCVEHPRLVGMGATVLMLVGLAGWIVMASLGWSIGVALRVSPITSAVVFLAGGAIFLCERLSTYALAALRGARRFDVANGVMIFATILWSFGAVLLLVGGLGLIPLVTWQALSAVLEAGATFFAAKRWVPRLKLRFRRPEFAILRRYVEFSLWSQLTAVLGGSIWEIPPLLIGALLGSPQIVPYYIGQIFPSAVCGLALRSTEVLFPAASESQHRGASVSEVLDTGTRLSLIAVVPISIVLWFCASRVLELWVGSASVGAVTIMRVLLLVEILNTAGFGCGSVLWGIGEVRWLMAISLAMAVGVTIAGVCMVVRFGSVGGAYALLIAMAAATPAFFEVAARKTGSSATKLLRSVTTGLVAPAGICLAVAALMNFLLPSGSWAATLAISLVSAAAYVVVLRHHGARPAEARMISLVLASPKELAKALIG